ncbi:hypothetical protein Syun_018809 [Stephania yunnanensis]|uniref:Uncharacterized protein n=1 Tax=Stephania yunnanensis TaxID=152371 RepID=A0AAP0NVC9_9MAGN
MSYTLPGVQAEEANITAYIKKIASKKFIDLDFSHFCYFFILSLLFSQCKLTLCWVLGFPRGKKFETIFENFNKIENKFH